MISALFGPNRLMRCPELVVTLTANVIRSNPESAIIYRTFTDSTRLLHKNPDARDQLREALAMTSSPKAPNCQGPARGVLNAAQQINARITLSTNGGIYIKQTSSDICADLLDGCTEAFKRAIHDMCEWAVLAGLANRVKAPKNQRGHRKDLQGITPNIDKHATLNAHDRKAHLVVKNYTDKLPTGKNNYTHTKALWKRHLASILVGAPRYPDRLKAAGLTANDICTNPACS